MSEAELVSDVVDDARYRTCASTHRGTVRRHNEDRFVSRPDLGLWAVADGAGGHDAGQFASTTVSAALQSLPDDMLPAEMLREVRARLSNAHIALREQAATLRPDAMIATTVVVLLASEKHYACLWLGDSRIYLLRGGVFSRVTRDHSLVQELIDAGAITEHEAEHHPRANVITRAIGADTSGIEIDMVTDRLYPGDRFLLCSDGLTKALDEAAICGLLGAADDRPAERLIRAALANDATDNVTAVTVEVVAWPS